MFDNKDLSGNVTVTSDLAIVVPVAGNISVKGLNISQVASAIQTALSAALVSPSVTVTLVSESNTAYLSGAATGDVALKPGETLAMALTAAKVSSSGDLTRVSIVRGGAPLGPYDVLAMNAAGQPGPALASGDLIAIPTKPVVVAVTGAVKASATAYLGPTEPLGDALQQVQTSDDADTQMIRLTRGGASSYTSVGGVALACPGQSGDQLMVGRIANVIVLGNVKKSGPIVLKGDQTLVSALQAAGGPGKDGDLGNIRVIPAGSDATSAGRLYNITLLANGDTTQNPVLGDGDTVSVPTAKPPVDPKVMFAAILLILKKAGVKLPKI
ncbi:MAG: polysaccharide biosynthesis/export family protein [Candidatus Eremiobacteraeota bacterium]|nr:polysaccharide biosynthesis/export family protein [Candidatus Eremiobacteraeota bacterium]